MNKIVILYASYHHNNTEKVVKHLQSKLDCDINNLITNFNFYIGNYQTIILASGISFCKFHDLIYKFVQEHNFENKNVIIVYTYGAKLYPYTSSLKRLLKKRKANILGSCGCKGYDTYVFKSLGGIAKNHPNEQDFNKIETKVKQYLSRK
mgnify:FL=1